MSKLPGADSGVGAIQNINRRDDQPAAPGEHLRPEYGKPRDVDGIVGRRQGFGLVKNDGGRVEPPLLREKYAVSLVSGGVIGIQFQRAPVFPLSAGKIPLEHFLDLA